jgi:hypothetical protein
MNIGVAMVGGGGRRENDFYATPPEATRALLPVIRHWPQAVWEPACGDGAMSRVLERSGGYEVFSSDIKLRGAGLELDFLKSNIQIRTAIITNPPYDQAAEFITHAVETLATPYVAMLLKMTFWTAAKRAALFRKHTPAFICPLTWRLDFLNLGAPTISFMWCLWEPGEKLAKTVLLDHPDAGLRQYF